MHNGPLPSPALPRVGLLACLAGFVAAGCATNSPPPEVRIDVAASSTSGSPVPTGPKTAAVAGSEQLTQLFDGKTLRGWQITDFAGHGEVKVEDGKLILESGVMTGVTWTNETPRMNYGSLEAMRVDGSDFFCGLTFPVGEDPCSLIVGGWGGGVVGLSSLDGEDAANNDTTHYMSFETGKWYPIRLRVTPGRIEAWIDKDQVVKTETKDRRLSIRVEVEPSKPLGFASWSTTAALRNITLRRLD